MCAYFASRNPTGMIEKLKLIKLIYLSERDFLAKHHFPMLWDELYSLPHGPICSSTLNGIDGSIDEDVWGEFLARNGNIVVAMKKFGKDDLDEISEAEFASLEGVWAEFGGRTASNLRNFTHDNCAEYTETSKGRIPISYKDVLEAVGAENADGAEREIASLRKAQSALTA